MAGREAELARLVLERLQRHAALGGRLHVVGVDADDPVHPAAVDDDRVGHVGLEPALGGGAAGARDDVDPVLVREREHGDDVLGAADQRDRRGRRQRPRAEDRLELAEVVDAAALERVSVGDDVLRAEDPLQALDDRLSGQRHACLSFVGQWKMGYERSSTGSVAVRIAW